MLHQVIATAIVYLYQSRLKCYNAFSCGCSEFSRGLLPHTWSGCPTRIQAVQASIASLLVLRLICRNLFCDAGQQPCSCCLLGTLSDVLHCSRPCAAPGANQIPGELQLLTCSSIYCVLRLSNRALLSFLVWLPLPIFALCIYV